MFTKLYARRHIIRLDNNYLTNCITMTTKPVTKFDKHPVQVSVI